MNKIFGILLVFFLLIGVVFLSACQQYTVGRNIRGLSDDQNLYICNNGEDENESLLYYGCNNPPYSTPSSCGNIGVDHYRDEGYSHVEFKCCFDLGQGSRLRRWDCYLDDNITNNDTVIREI